MAKTINYEKRLLEIATTAFGELSDEAVLHLLAERKQLQELAEQYDKLQQEQVALDRAEAEKTDVEKELHRLNALISPDKPDEELIHLVEERKTWEAKMTAVEAEITHLKSGEVIPDQESAARSVAAPVPPVAVERPVQETPVMSETAPVVETPILNDQVSAAVVIDQEFGQERITETSLPESSEFFPYLENLKQNASSLGRLLEDLPANAKKDKLFMLEVAKIDPAYAMHYADKSVLQRDEDFNIRVASMKNNRNSGSALAEMIPEARTAKVVMAAIRSDYRNVRFLLPQMEGYDEMLARAKTGALQRMKELKESADIALLIPKMLQKDKAFMKQVEEIVPKSEE